MGLYKPPHREKGYCRAMRRWVMMYKYHIENDQNKGFIGIKVYLPLQRPEPVND